MTYTFTPTGVCPSEITIEMDDQNIIQSISSSAAAVEICRVFLYL